MQTLKTSAIVILMMTFLYAAYVSMTTPPDPLPPGLESQLVESEMAEIPESFDDFIISDGVPEDEGEMAFAAAPPAASASSPDHSDGVTSFDSLNQNHADVQPVDPADSTDSPAGTPDPSFQMSDLASTSGSSSPIGRLPAVEGTSEGVAVVPEPGREYPSTGTSFSLPDPVEAAQVGVQDQAKDAPEPPPESTEANESEKNAASDVAAAGLANAIANADRQYESDRRREALATLSLFYETPNLTSEQREQLLVRLDPLARDVIYSPEHLLEEPHRVGSNETLMDIAQKYDVPWELLANINGISDPVTVLPGTDLKVVRGPFRADVDLKNQELTLFLGDLYAGRFPVGIGNDPEPRSGTYAIQEKKSAKTYYDMAGTPIPPGNPRNPYGAMWIDLGQGICLHGSPKPDRATEEGCISIAGDYSRDVFGILSEGSSVTIR